MTMDEQLAPARAPEAALTPGSQLADLQQRLTRSEEALALLKAQRAEDLARLAEISRTRDLLESRAAAQMEIVSRTQAKGRETEKLIEALEQRAGSGRFGPVDGESDDFVRPLAGFGGKSWKGRQSEAQWFERTIELARSTHKAGDLVAAQILFDAALLLNQSPSLWTELAHVLREQELFTGAERAYDRALASDPDNAENLFLAGFCAEKAGRKEAAARRYDAALSKDPSLVDRYDHLKDFNARLFD
jgi:tetratricopeptide (TPR) repeat protein